MSVTKKKIFFIDICNSIADINGQLEKLGFQTDVYPSPVPSEVFNEDLFWKAEPIWPVVNLVKKLAKTYSIVYLTARREEMRPVTQEWLDAYSLPAGPIIHTNGRPKGELALNLAPVNWIGGAIEDSPQEIEKYLEALPTIRLIIPEWPYNFRTKGIRIPLKENESSFIDCKGRW